MGFTSSSKDSVTVGEVKKLLQEFREWLKEVRESKGSVDHVETIQGLPNEIISIVEEVKIYFCPPSKPKTFEETNSGNVLPPELAQRVRSFKKRFEERRAQSLQSK